MVAQDIPLILVVEDETLIRWNAVEMIFDAGWEALEAANAEEALERLSANPGVSVLFTDVNMPGSLDGVELAHIVHRSHPHMQIVITSAKGAVQDGEIPDDGTFLPKPYGVNDLQRVVEQKLA
jgi:DNA-binding NtrC family response regulator